MNIYDKVLSRNLLKILSVYFLFTVSIASADDHNEKRHDRKHESNIVSSDHKKDKGNELTGEASAWIFAIANITVVLSLFSKGLVRFTTLRKTIKERILFLNKIQKKYLASFHYILNPMALIIAFLHLYLSQCLTSHLPELGLTLISIIGIAGISVKLKISPKSFRGAVYRFHANPMPSGIVMIILLIGHSIID